MTLNSHASYPSARSYVLKLHRDAMPGHGRIFGRLENLSTGQHFDFSTADELLARLADDVAPIAREPGGSAPDGGKTA